MKKIALMALCALSLFAGAGTNDLASVMGQVTVSRLEALASQRRLQSRVVTNGTMICTYVQAGRTWTVTNRLFSATGYVKPPVYSKLKMYVVFSRAGDWAPLKEWLQSQTVEGINAWEAFDMCNEVSADNPLFLQWLQAAEAALGVDDATAQALLEQCKQ